jgi:hypothetical protein
MTPNGNMQTTQEVEDSTKDDSEDDNEEKQWS